MTARFNVNTSGLVSPLRAIVSVIGVSGLPRICLTASFRVMPLTKVSSSFTIRSPALMPAREAGEFAARADLHLAIRFLVEIARMRIESREHASNRLADELLVVDRFDVVA